MKFQKKKQPVKPSRKNIVLKSEIRGERRTQEISAQSRFKHSFIKNLFTSTGRTGRSEYWLFCLSSWTTGITTGLIFTLMDKTTTSRLFVFFTFFILWTVMTLTGATIRRYHDTGLSGWHLLLSAASVIFFYLVLFIPFYLTNQEERYLFKKSLFHSDNKRRRNFGLNALIGPSSFFYLGKKRK